MPNINKTIGSSTYLFNNIVINTAPHPYIGQYGPIKKPLFTNLFSAIATTNTSIHQPNIAYEENSNKYNVCFVKRQLERENDEKAS